MTATRKIICALALIAGLASCQLMPAASPSTTTAAPAASAPAGTQSGRYRVLFDASHGETFGNADWVISASRPDPLGERASPRVETDWTGALSAWGVALHKTGRYQLMTLPRGGQISYGERTNQLDLANFQVFVVPEPNVRFADAEKAAIMTFVQNGGGLFMIADHDQSDRNSDGMDSLRIWNDLMSDNAVQGGNPFGFYFDTLNIGSDNPRDIAPGAAAGPVIRGPFGNVTGSIIRGGTTATIAPADNPSVQALLYRSRADTQGRSGVFFLTSAFGKGRVAAWGDSSPIDDGTGSVGEQLFNGWDDAAGSNAILALNATEWLAQGSAGAPVVANIPTVTTPATGSNTAPHRALVQNGDFERGQAGWRALSSDNRAIIGSEQAHGGKQSAGLCGYNDCDEALAQTISLPTDARTIRLSYYSTITTQETRHAFDFLNIELREPGGKLLQMIERLSDGSPAASWRRSNFDLSDYAGQTLELVFRASCGKIRPTKFFVDDIEITTQ
ncbi:MAG: hydrolase [Roseiflexaceae bacterium]